MRFYNYNKEKSGPYFADVYLIAFFLAIVLVVLLIGFGYGIKFLIGFVIKYYLWVFGVLALIVIIRHFWNKGKRRADVCECH